MAESGEELKSLLIKVKEESEKAHLKLSIQKTKIMASGPIISWQIEREKVETVRDFIFLASKITVDGDCSHEVKRRLLLGKKAMTNPDSVLKTRDISLLTKAHIVKGRFFFLIVMYRCVIWTTKKAECQRSFQIVLLEKTLKSPLDCKEFKLINPKESTLNFDWKD